MVQSTVERKVKQLTQLEFVKQSTAWIGSKTPQTVELYLYKDGVISLEKLKFAPGLNKLIDEIVTNAIDHWINYPKAVKNIRIQFDHSTGEISVYNDGPGIVVEDVSNVNGKLMKTPQLIASEFHSGDNFKEERLTGGCNGAGIKLVNAYSDYLILETYDAANKVYYSQRFSDRLNVIEPPHMSKTVPRGRGYSSKGFTKITFKPTYSAFGNTCSSTVDILIQSRVCYAAGFTGISVSYNDKPALKIQFAELVSMFNTIASDNNDDDSPQYERVLFKRKKRDSDINMEVYIAPSDGKFRQFSLVNSVYTFEGGNFIKHIQEQLVTHLKPKLTKLIGSQNKFNPNMILNNIHIFVKLFIRNPEFGGGNLKSRLDTPIEQFNEYEISTIDAARIWNILEPNIAGQFLNKFGDKKKKTTRTTLNIKKCEDAQRAGHRTKWRDCTLIIAEGDSAAGTIREGILHRSTDLSKEFYGIFNIQGVPINARKECRSIVDPRTDTQRIIRNDKLQKNERFNSMVKVIGLDYTKQYDTDIEFNTLRYGRIVVATDQDDDGKGQIFGLIMNFFTLFWPALIERGYICRLNTPIIRAYPHNIRLHIKEFYTDDEFKQWLNDKNTSQYNIQYYKGLGSHEEKERIQLFRDFERKLFIYRLDDAAVNQMEIYFGKLADLRKQILSTPPLAEEVNNQYIDVSKMLHSDVKAFQLDNISRKIPHILDGQVPARRKVIYTARKVFAKSNNRMKVNAFVNKVSEQTHYHHGEASLAVTVARMAQDFPGAKNFPFIRPRGQFGCVAPNTPILLWSGCIKAAEFIAIGDVLIGDDGQRRVVSELTSGVDTMYKIINGNLDNYVVNSNHILTLCYNNEADNTYSIRDINIQDYLALPNAEQCRYFGMTNASAIEWEEQPIDIDPYTIGQAIYCSVKYKYFIAPYIHINNKYIINSIQVRQSVLAGLIDTFGELVTIQGGYPIYRVLYNCNTAPLIKPTITIARSLGFAAYIDKLYSISIYGDNRSLARIPVRKSSNMITLESRMLNECPRIHMLQSIRIKRIGQGRFYGWTIDGNERFLLGDLTVTHNTRANGGKDIASPRYTFTNLNDRLCYQMFPRRDDYLLPYMYDDGDRIEPRYYIPILPLAILEYIEIPATGWKAKIWARDIWKVIDEVEALIKGSKSKCGKLPIWQQGGGEIRIYKKKQCSFGRYVFNAKKNELTVTNLPLGVFSCQISGCDTDDGGMRPELLKKPYDETSNSQVKITFTFKPEAAAMIRDKCGNAEIDCFEEYLNLKNGLDNHLNLININDCITTFKSYNEIVDVWFAARCDLYAKRIDREYTLCKLRIRYIENIIRFIANHCKYKIDHSISRAAVDKILKDAKYDRINHTLLFKPKYTPTEQLQDIINTAKCSYDYLINLRYSDMIQEANERRQTELKTEQQYLKGLEPDMKANPKGSYSWLRELAELKETIRIGLDVGWDYNKKMANFK